MNLKYKKGLFVRQEESLSEIILIVACLCVR